MPGFYPQEEYDLAGFCVGMVDRQNIIDGSSLQEGDVLVGISSSGVHSNGFSLVRKVLHIDETTIFSHYDQLDKPLGETLLTPTKIYVKPLLALMQQVHVKAVSHITGGGFYENIPRMLKAGLTARVEKAAVPVLPIFDVIKKAGNISEHDMFNTFNMGIGMVVAVAKQDADKALRLLSQSGEKAYIIGEITQGEEGVLLV